MRGDYGFPISSYYHQLGMLPPYWEIDPEAESVAKQPWRRWQWRPRRWRAQNTFAYRQRQRAQVHVEQGPCADLWDPWPGTW